MLKWREIVSPREEHTNWISNYINRSNIRQTKKVIFRNIYIYAFLYIYACNMQQLIKKAWNLKESKKGCGGGGGMKI